MATNNSINSNIPIEIAKGGTNATSMGTTDGVVYYDGTRLVTTGAGTSGQALTSNGSGSAPTYQALSGTSKLVLIQSQPASSSSTIDFTTGITSTYATYLFVLSNILPTTAGDILTLQVSTNGGSSWTAGTGYTSGSTYSAFNSGTWSNKNVNAGAIWDISDAISTSTPKYSASIYLYNITNSLTPMYMGYGSFTPNGGTFGYNLVTGNQSAVTNINAFRFAMSTSTISTGTFTLYGLKES